MSDRALVFGASGALGSAVCSHLRSVDVEVIPASRQGPKTPGDLSTAQPGWAAQLAPKSVTRAIWAQGANASGGILDDGPSQMVELFEANVLFIVSTVKELLDAEVLAEGARLVVVSSVWQETARDRKLAYVTSKAALAGLVRSLVADLGPIGISVNAVLPGVVDTPMTRRFLSEVQVRSLESETPIGRLVTAEEVARTCAWLSGSESAGISGQFVVVDGGWSSVRHV